MHWRLISVLGAAVMLAGCGKKSGTSVLTPTTTTNVQPGSQSATASRTDQSEADGGAANHEQTSSLVAPASEKDSAADGAVADTDTSLRELTQALRKYSFEHRRLPKTINEVIVAGYVQNPPPAPAGKKFEIDAKTVQVVLVKR